MRLIVCEKNLAAKRISEILSDKKSKMSGTEIPYYTFDDDIFVGLAGHVVDVGFPEELNSWTKISEDKLLKSDIIFKPTKVLIIKQLKNLAKKVDEVIIATDYDSEGELIGREAVDIIKEINPKVKIKRALFSAITKEDIQKAFKKLTKLDDNLADSSDARRIVDLVWGSVLTRSLSKSSKKMGQNYLSVGRVQTPVLKILVDRELERKKFVPQTYWTAKAFLDIEGTEYVAEYSVDKIFDEKEKKKLEILSVDEGEITEVKQTNTKKQPPIPFNTTGFLRDATRIGLTPSQAMSVISSLYLNGFVSYPRTDNTVYPKTINLRSLLKDLQKYTRFKDLTKEILSKKELVPTEGKKQTKDHPPIHPVGVPKGDELNIFEKRIYELVFRRFLATLSDESEELRTRLSINVGGYIFNLHGLKILKHGWRKFYNYNKLEDKELPALNEGDKVKVDSVVTEENQTSPPGRYGYSKIIKVMDELNLGTKSTRPSILQKLVQRNYVSKGSQLVPSKIAMKVVESLEKYASEITQPEMTANLEKEMEKIELAKRKKERVIDDSKKILRKVLKEMVKNSEKIGNEVRKAYYWDPLGTCPKCNEGEMRMIKSKKSGKRFVGCSRFPKCINGWPAPQKGRLMVSNDLCKHCGLRQVTISVPGRRFWKLCLNLKCPGRKSKEDKKLKKQTKETKTTKKKTPAKKKTKSKTSKTKTSKSKKPTKETKTK